MNRRIPLSVRMSKIQRNPLMQERVGCCSALVFCLVAGFHIAFVSLLLYTIGHFVVKYW